MRHQIIHLNQFLKHNKISTTDGYVVSFNYYQKLIDAFTGSDIKNFEIALKNTLHLLQYLDNLTPDEDGCISISQSVFIQHLNNAFYSRIKTILYDLKIMNRVQHNDNSYYVKGVKPMRYRFYTDYSKANDLCLVLFERDTKPSFTTDNGKYNKKFVDTVKGTEIDLNGAINAEYQNHLQKYNCQLLDGEDLYFTEASKLRKRINQIFYIVKTRYIKSGSKSNRIYHSLTNLSKISRKHLTFKGDLFNDIDIVNCQPLLLAYLIKSNGLEVDEKYLKDVEQGQLYEQFMHVFEDRNKTKVELYKSIYFKFAENKAANLMFKKLYPKTWDSLKIISEADRCTMASKLQDIEADIFNNIRVKDSKGYYSLFDSIYFTEINDAGYIISQLLEKFSEYGLNPKIKLNDGTEFDKY